MIDLGNAIRSGYTDYVFELIEQNTSIGCSALSRLGFQFETTLRRLPKEEDTTNAKKTDVASQKPREKMHVTPFQLAIIAQKADIVYIMLQSMVQFTNFPLESIKRLLQKKTKMDFTKGDPDTYVLDDRTLDQINSFHLAARFHAQSLLVIVRFLRDHDMLEHILHLLEECDPHMGKTPLHMAAKSPSSLPLRILLLCDVQVDTKDKRGYTALHMASKEGLDINCQVLLEHQADPNAYGTHQYCKTPLLRARSPKVVSLLLKYGANPFVRESSSNKSAFEILLQRHPQAVEEIMYAGIETNGQRLDSGFLKIIFNFELFFREGLEKEDPVQSEYPKRHDQVNEMASHVKIIQSNYKDLLKNPLAEAFLHMKWQLVDSLFYFNSICYTIFLLMLTIMSYTMGEMSRCEMQPEIQQKLNTTCSNHNKVSDNNFWHVVEYHLDSTDSKTFALGVGFVASFIMSLIGLILFSIREVVQVMMNFKTYISSFENLMEALIMILTMMNMTLMFFNKDVAIHFGAWAVFFGWWELTLLLGRIPTIGIFIYLSLDVLKTLIVFFLLFLPALMAFAFTFHLLLPSNETFGDPFTSLLKILAMMVGEFDFQSNFLFESSLLDYGQISTQLAFFFFLLIGNIVIANLLIGLTVNKTELLFKKAGVVRLETMVHQVHGIGKFFQAKSERSFWRVLAQKTKLFDVLNFLVTKGENTKSEQPSPWKVCVMPHSIDQIQMNSKGSQFLDAQRNLDTNSTTFDKSYFVYLYDDLHGCVKEKLPFTIPWWVIAHTLSILHDQKLKNDNQNAQEMEKGAITEQDMDDLHLAMSKDRLIKKETANSGVNINEAIDILIKEDPLRKRKVSAQPPLEKVEEEECNSDEIAKKLEMKIQAMQASLQQLQMVQIATMQSNFQEIQELFRKYNEQAL